MKKGLSIVLGLMLAAAAFADPITPERAMQIAQEFIVPGNTMTMTRRAKAMRATTANSPYYVISRGENLGYVVVAGDDCLPEVLGYTDSGNFDADNLPPALKDMLDCWQMAVEQAQADGTNVSEAKSRKAKVFAPAASNRVSIAPFVTSHWHQTSPYNDNCPFLKGTSNRAVTGCVATAAAQILYYWRKDLPSTLQSKTPTYDYGDAPVKNSVAKGTPMKWDLMLDKYGSESKEYKQAVAEFVFATGAATWLTYGSSTSGNIEKIPATFSSFFGMNGGTVKYRESYSQEAWTQLIYDELVQRRPVMYTGVHPDQGGHAVFIHGYQAGTDRMYFNFGWGGQGDGYWTTELTTGMNGFNDYQSCLIGAYPKRYNITGNIELPKKFYSGASNEVKIRLTNNATVANVPGVYVFMNTTGKAPSSRSGYKFKELKEGLEVDETKEFVCNLSPVAGKINYIYVTDNNLNIIVQKEIMPVEGVSEMVINSINADGSSDYEEFDGEKYHVVYNDGSSAFVNATNVTPVGASGNIRLNIQRYDAVNKEWDNVGTKTSEITAKGNETVTTTFNLLSTSTCPIELNTYYRGYITNSPSATFNLSVAEGADSVVRFVMKGANMEVTGFENNVLSLKGNFDNTLFDSNSFARRASYSTANVYDLTQCSNVLHVTQNINPNALIYVADDSKAVGPNIIKGGICDELVLQYGYDFAPKADFKAKNAQIILPSTPASWMLVTSPFAANVPEGIIAREVLSHTLSGIGGKTNNVKTLVAGKTYLLMTSSHDNIVLSATDVDVVANPVQNTDSAFVGTYVATQVPAGSMLINDEETQYFVPVEEGTPVPALGGYFVDETITKQFRAYSELTVDPAYLILAQNIEQAYCILNDYKDVVKRAAYESFLSGIKQAEATFSERSIGSSSQVKTYAAKLLEDADEYKRQIQNAGSREIDFTGNIENPSFENKKTTGWTLGTMEGVTAVGGIYDGTQANGYRAVGLDGHYIFQSLIASADSSSVGIEQEVKNLTPGYYRVSAMLGTDENSVVVLFAGDSVAVTYGHKFGRLYLSKTTIEKVRVDATEGSFTGVLRIGVKAGRWYKADNFTLTYVGSLAETDDEEVSVNDIKPDAHSSAEGIYTLQGVRVKNADAPGLYIMNGRKLLKR